MGLEEMFTSISQRINDMFGFPDQLYGELIWSTIILICFLLIGWIVEHIFERYFKKLAKKTKTKLDDEILKNVKRPIYILVVFFGIYFFIHNISILGQYVGQRIIDDTTNAFGWDIQKQIDEGNLAIKKTSNDKYNLILNFNTNEVPQIITTINETFELN